MLSTKHFVNFLTKSNARLQLYLVIGVGLLASWALYKHKFIWILLLLGQPVGGIIPQTWRTTCMNLKQGSIFVYYAVVGYECPCIWELLLVPTWAEPVLHMQFNIQIIMV